MRIIGKLLIGAIALLMLLSLVPAMIPDPDYSPGAREWLAIANAPVTVADNENRFHAQVGFQAAADADMVEFGASLVSDTNRVLQTNGTEFDAAWQNPPLSLSQALADTDLDVALDDPQAWIADNRQLLRQLVAENALLLERHHELTQMTGYALTLTPDYRSPIPNYSSLSRIHRLNSLAIAAAVVDDVANLPRLRESIDKQRFAFADAASIIEKLTALSLLHFDLSLYAKLIALPEAIAYHEPFPALDAEERTLKKGYINEFASASSLFDAAGLSGDNPDWFEAMLVSLYLKPRNLENHAHEHTWMHLLSLESLPLAERKNTQNDTAYSWWDRYTDPVGYILYEISRPNFTYHDRIEHLDGLITLINVAAEIHRRSLRDAAINAYLENVDAGANPGYTGASLGYDASTHELYVSIPGYQPAPRSNPTQQPPRIALR